MRIKLLALCGSLRTGSSNRALLEAARQVQPDNIEISIYDGIAALPHFSPDLDDNALLPDAAKVLRQRVEDADGLVISCPEYMHCLPGSFKNALDWMVGSEKFPGKAVALFQATSRHEHVPALLRDVLKTMAADVVEEASFVLPATTNRIEADGLAADPEIAAAIRDKLQCFAGRIRSGI
ncbi:NADPH-dependent FMN reductase [Roseibium aggregatum]|uniref:NADPH-dependent FMN reductase n=1 Tax=Roseibium aggregatum TaxID=187304 RepID=UPI001AD92EC4|nr:NAD(P)H-dependent oxidoreductase [Roseibium aggregatum]